MTLWKKKLKKEKATTNSTIAGRDLEADHVIHIWVGFVEIMLIMNAWFVHSCTEWPVLFKFKCSHAKALS